MPKTKPIFRVMLLVLLSLGWPLYAANTIEGAKRYRTDAITNKGEKWRIGYYEGGPYINYPANLKAIAKGLTQLGWMDRTDVAEMTNASDAKGIWKSLGHTQSDYLRFVPDAFYSAGWDNTLRARNKAAVIGRLQGKQLDFMIAMGTWAGQDLANNLHSVPTMVVSTSDPVKSGIIKSAAQSGFRHVHARCDPNRYIRQVRLFHDIIGFRRLGIVYEDSVAGKSYAALGDIEKVSAQRGFKLVTCNAPWAGVPRQVSTQKLIDCHNKLAPRIDALFLTVHNGVDAHHMDEILAPLVEHNIPTWSQRGSEEVRQGVLLSISRAGFGPVGMYHAKIMAKILNGARPGDLNQIFEDPKKIAINLKTAAAIEFKPPRGLMRVADHIYK